MSSFAKLDCGIVDSTIWMQPHDVLRVWIALLAKADARGFVRASVPAMAHLCMVDMQRMEEILELLTSPDPYSRTPTNDGRRLSAVDGGWEIVNYTAYRNTRDADSRREYQREWDRKNRPSGHLRAQRSPTQSDTVRHSPPQAEAEAEEDKSIDVANATSSAGKPANACPHQEIIAAYHRILPELRQVRAWNATRQRLLQARWRESRERQEVGWWEDFFGYVRRCGFLMGRSEGRGGAPPFQADLEWLVRPSNFVKVIEGRYEGGGHD